MTYHNPHSETTKPDRFFDFLMWILGLKKDPAALVPIPENFVYPNSRTPIDIQKPLVSWINHSTFFIELSGSRFLTDPIWSKRCSPVPLIGPKRLHEAPVSIEELPTIDYVIISHNHYDHLDKKSVRKLHKRFPHILWIVPIGVKSWFAKNFASAHVVELKWWESVVSKDGKFTFTAVPAQHFSGRSFFDYNHTEWMGCVVQNKDKCFYFAGDSGYNSFDFRQIGKRFPSIDLSLIPIGAYLPRHFMAKIHINPAEAVTVHKEVSSKLSLAGHFNTFKLTSEQRKQPPYDLYLALQHENIPHEHFRVLEPGQKINW